MIVIGDIFRPTLQSRIEQRLHNNDYQTCFCHFQMTSKHKQEIFDKLSKVELELDRLLEDNERSIKVHLLHQYNDIKDATQIVINYVANVEGTTVTEIHKRLNLCE